MQTFAEFLAESYRSNVPLTWNLSHLARATATFTVDSTKVTVAFEQRAPDGPWHVLFEVHKANETEVAHSAFGIFNGVLQAVEEFLQTREPDSMVFATKRDSLAGIYQTYLPRESATIENLGYKLTGPHRVDPYTEFMLKRKS